MTSRESGLIKKGILGLGLIEFKEKEGLEKIYHCSCGTDISKKKICNHFSGSKEHKDTYRMVSNLLKIWGLVESKSSMVEIVNKENYEQIII